MIELARVRELMPRGVLVAVNHSGGKDSQAMLLKLLAAGIEPSDIAVFHAPLCRWKGDWSPEWPGTEDHIAATVPAGIPIITAYSARSWWEMVDSRKRFPSPQQRQCTSDLKRGPLEREMRRYLKANPRFGGRVVSCMGMRAEESDNREKLPLFKVNKRQSIAGRQWLNLNPILNMKLAEVWATIAAAGQKPLWVYAAGMTRASCRLCIMASQADIKRSAEIDPENFQLYARKEIEHGHTMDMGGRYLTERTGFAV